MQASADPHQAPPCGTRQAGPWAGQVVPCAARFDGCQVRRGNPNDQCTVMNAGLGAWQAGDRGWLSEQGVSVGQRPGRGGDLRGHLSSLVFRPKAWKMGLREGGKLVAQVSLGWGLRPFSSFSFSFSFRPCSAAVLLILSIQRLECHCLEVWVTDGQQRRPAS